MNSKDRFLNKVDKKENGCWMWTSSGSPNGYGKFHFNGKYQWAHRVSYMLFKGEIPEGMTIDHICMNKRCVNPDHLRVMTLAENILISNGITAQHKRKTHCPKGHEYTPENTILKKQSNSIGRWCRQCSIEYFRELRRKRK